MVTLNLNRMKIRDVVALVKYGQGLVVFDSYLSYLRFIKPVEREKYLLQIVELTMKMKPRPGDERNAIKLSGLNVDSKPCHLISQGATKETLLEIVHLPQEELERSFKLLLTVFSIVYEREYKKHRNDPERMWYWDYMELSNTMKFLKMDDTKTIDLSNW